MEKRSGFKWSIVGMSPALAKHQFIISEGKHEGKHSALFLSCSPNPNHDSRLRENRVRNSYKKFAQIICHLYIIYISNRHILLFHVVSPLVERSAIFKRLPHGMAKADGRMDPEPAARGAPSRARELSWDGCGEKAMVYSRYNNIYIYRYI